jgi:fructose-1,6-bisphosphatase/sedoheptulose 1,7-bisphosphatase-like protein
MFRAVRVPLVLNEGVTIGSLYVATALDRRFAEQLDRMSRARTAIISDGSVIAATLATSAAHQLEAALRHGSPDEGVIELDGGSQAYLRLATAGPASIYAISSIDEALARP